MLDQNISPDDALRSRILAEIDGRKRGRFKIAIVTLMQVFGFNAARRVHQASLQWVLGRLNEWGIGYELPGDTSANDDIILFRTAPAPVATSADTLPHAAPAQKLHTPHQMKTGASAELDTLPPLTSPLALLFSIDGAPDEHHSHRLALAIQHAIWQYRPVCLFIDAGDELYSFACGYVSAMLRRRALMARWSDGYGVAHIAPELIPAQRLAYYLGQGDNASEGRFPETGAVYIVRENPDDLEDNELIRVAREQLIPHTYSLVAQFGATSAGPDEHVRLRDAPEFGALFRWIAAFAGHHHAPEPGTGQRIDVSALLAEACQARDTLLDQHTLQPVDASFRAGFESTEHMVLKSAVLHCLRGRFPHEAIAVEEYIEQQDSEHSDDGAIIDQARRDRPDLRVGSSLWVEIETLRGVALNGSNPFFALEVKLRRKLAGMRAVAEIWLLVPSDVALLASDQVRAIARNLNVALGSPKVRPGLVDLERNVPVFLDDAASPAPSAPRLSGISLRRERVEQREPLTLDDIAGYAEVKRNLQSSLLAPLMQRQKYASYGIFAARGLLLYGLPGCGKSWIGKVLADTAGITSRVVLPSDLTSMWLGEGVTKTRALFDWAIKQSQCLLVLDEIDAVASARDTHQMHSNEKRQVNELLVQLDRIADRGVILVATTNHLRGVDAAVQRSGRFDMKLPVFPPTEVDRRELFRYYISPPRLYNIAGVETIALGALAEQTPLFTPADIRGVVQGAVRAAIGQAGDAKPPTLTTEDLERAIRTHSRSIRSDQAKEWLDEVAEDLGRQEPRVAWLDAEIRRAWPMKDRS